MPPTIRFHLDEHVPPSIAEGLRRRGISATTTPAAGLRGASDAKQLDFAHSEDRVMATCDTDFLRLHQQGVPHAGIAYSPKGRRSIGELLHGLVMLAECLNADEMKNHVEYL